MRPLGVLGEGASARRGSGFTLIELMLVVAILGVLSALSVPLFHERSMRAHRAEGITGLHGIHRAQVMYYDANSKYGDTFDEIGFALDGGQRIDERTLKARTYTFTVRAVPLDGNERGNFQAIATADLDPGDAVLDILMIENELEVVR
jgi:prepilin-type N-terminal cleavage/methylation domain-containing protein